MSNDQYINDEHDHPEATAKRGPSIHTRVRELSEATRASNEPLGVSILKRADHVNERLFTVQSRLTDILRRLIGPEPIEETDAGRDGPDGLLHMIACRQDRSMQSLCEIEILIERIENTL